MNSRLLGVEEDSLSRTLAFNCEHGYAQEEYVAKREEREQIYFFSECAS